MIIVRKRSANFKKKSSHTESNSVLRIPLGFEPLPLEWAKFQGNGSNNGLIKSQRNRKFRFKLIK